MKLLIATSTGHSAGLIKGQGKYFKNQGYTVIYSSSNENEARNLVADEGLIFEPVPFSREPNLLRDIYCLFLACKVLRKYRPNIVNAGTPKAGLIYMLAAKIVGIKVRIFTLRGLRSITLNGIKKRIVFLCERISCICATKIIAISPSLKEEAVKLKLSKHEKISVLSKGSSNGVDVDRFSVTHQMICQSKIEKEKLGISHDDFVFGFIGRIVIDKGVLELIDAFETFGENQKCKLILAGSFENNNSIPKVYMEKIQNNKDIITIGYIKNISLYMFIFDVLILPSYREGFGNVVIEAAAMEIPSIVSNVPGAKDSIVNNETGLLVNPRDKHDLYEKMNFYFNNRNIKKQHGMQARIRVLKYFTNETIWHSLLEEYKSHLAIYKPIFERTP